MLLSRPSSVSSVSHESGVSREEEEEEEEEGSFEAKAMEGEDDSSGDIGIVTETGHRPRQMGILPALCISQMSKETYYTVKRDQGRWGFFRLFASHRGVPFQSLHCQKRPTTVSKETYYTVPLFASHRGVPFQIHSRAHGGLARKRRAIWTAFGVESTRFRV